MDKASLLREIIEIDKRLSSIRQTLFDNNFIAASDLMNEAIINMSAAAESFNWTDDYSEGAEPNCRLV